MYLEVTTVVPCPVGCLKYCPQEVIAARYKGERLLSVETFEKCLRNCPKDVPIYFAGYSEPFCNPEFMSLLNLAESHGHPIALFTTLVGASTKDVEQLCEKKFVAFCLHLPDGEVFKMPQNSEYKDNVFKTITSISNLNFSIMNDCFVTNRREEVSRGQKPKPRSFGYCLKIEDPMPVMVPNGDLYLCCMDHGLEAKIGNLLTEKLEDAIARIKGSGGFPMCRYCIYNIPLLRRFAQQGKALIRNVMNWQPSC